MAAITSNGTGGGLWSETSTWDGGVVPVDGDSVTISASDTVTFDVDQSGFATGLAGLDINGELNFATDGTYCYLKMAGNVTGDGNFYIGTEADPIPVPAGSTPEVAVLEFNGDYEVTDGNLTVSVYSEDQRAPSFAIDSKTSDTEIVLAEGVDADWLREGDVIAITDTNTNGVLDDRDEIFKVSAYDSGTRTITINSSASASDLWDPFVSGLTRNVNQNDGTDRVLLLSRPICMWNRNQQSNNGIFAGVDDGIMSGARAYYLNRGALNICDNWTVQYCSFSNVFRGGGAYQGSGHTFTSCTISNATNGGGVYQGSGHTFTSCTISNVTNGSGAMYGTGHIVEYCTISNVNQGGGAMYGTNYLFIGNTSDGSANGFFYQSTFCKAYNQNMPESTEFTDYNNATYNPQWAYTESFDHDQVSGAYRAWTLGGIIDKVSDVYPTEQDYSYLISCESDDYYGYYQKRVTLSAGKTITLTSYLRKDKTMSTLPKIQLAQWYNAEQQEITTAIDEFEMTDSVDTWESKTMSYTNSSSVDEELIVRAIAKDATAEVHALPVIQVNDGLRFVGLTTA